MLAESEEDNSISDPIDYIVQAINSIRFDRPQCPIRRLQAYLQVKGLDLNVLEDHLRIYTVERTINATKNWVQKLIVQGANGSEIMETTPVIVLTPVLLFRDHVDRVYQVVEYYSADSSVKTLFVNYLQDTGCMEFEVQTVLSSLGQERSLTGGLAYALQVIRNVKFDWDKCSVKVLEDHLQEKNLGLEILDDNPVLFSVFKTKIV